MVLGLSNSTELKIKVTSDKDCVQVYSVEWPADQVKEKIEQAFVSVQGEAKVPGFRAGRTPMDLIKQSFKDAAYARAQDTLLQEGVSETLKSKKVNPVSSPLVKTMNFHPEKAFQFEFQIEVAPKFKLASFKGMKLTKSEKAIGEEEIQKSLTSISEMNAKLVESKMETLENKQFAVIDYEGFLDEKAIPGAKATNFLLDMSAPQAIAGLAEGLVGLKAGEEKDVPVTFPADSPAKDLAGKQAHFKVKLQAIKEKAVPNIDDELAKDMGFPNLEELKKRIRENMETEAKTASKRDVENQIIEKLLAENEFVVPPTLVDQQTDHLVDRQKNQWLRQGIGPDDQVKLIDAAKPELRKKAEKDIRLAYIMEAFVESEKITVQPEEIEARVKEILSKSSPAERAGLEKALQGDLKSRLEGELRENKIFETILQQAKFK
jgi:trigger factor